MTGWCVCFLALCSVSLIHLFLINSSWPWLPWLYRKFWIWVMSAFVQYCGCYSEFLTSECKLYNKFANIHIFGGGARLGSQWIYKWRRTVVSIILSPPIRNIECFSIYLVLWFLSSEVCSFPHLPFEHILLDLYLFPPIVIERKSIGSGSPSSSSQHQGDLFVLEKHRAGIWDKDRS